MEEKLRVPLEAIGTNVIVDFEEIQCDLNCVLMMPRGATLFVEFSNGPKTALHIYLDINFAPYGKYATIRPKSVRRGLRRRLSAS